MKININDIAKEAGVSIATVSRVINGKEGASEATREKVKKIIEKYSYSSNQVGIHDLYRKSLRSVAILTVDIRVPHYARTAYTMEREFSKHGYAVYLCNTGGDIETTVNYLTDVLEEQVAGIVLVGSVFDEIGKDPRVEHYLRMAPVVMANGKLNLPNSYSVLVDDVFGIARMVQYVYKHGKRDIFYLSGATTDSAQNKKTGFLQGMNLCGLNTDGKIIDTEDSIEGGMRAAEEILSSGRACDAMVCGEDIVAVGALKKLLRKHIAVPEKIAVTGYNNSMISRNIEPELTGVDNKPEQVALLCVQLLESLIDHTDSYSSVTLQPEIVKGGTV